MIRKASLFAFIFMMCANFVNAQDVTPDSTGMSTDAHTFCQNVKMGWCLGNSFESDGSETAWGNPRTTQAMIKKLKADGFNAIRIPVRWYPHLDSETDMTIKADFIKRVKEVVDWCLDEGMIVMINTHHETWLENKCTLGMQYTNNQKLKKLWTNIATYFRDYDDRLVFGATNECVMKSSSGAWLDGTEENYKVQNSYLQTFVDAVRATGGKNYYRNLIVQTYKCDPSDGIAHLIVPTDKVEGRLSVEFHYYNPYTYCSGASDSYYYWGDKYKNMGKSVTPDGNERTLANQFRNFRKTWYENGLGVVVGEYGVSHHYTNAEKTLQDENEGYYLQCLVSEARKNGFAAFVWDNNAFGNGSEKFGIYNRGNNMTNMCTFLTDGITEGAKSEFEELGEEESDKDWGAGGTELWSGSQEMNWGQGLQLYITSTQLANCTDEARIVIYYDQVASATYDDIQVVDNSWKGIDFTVETSTFTGDFSPRNYYGTTDASHITPFSITGTALASVKANGMHIQGYGVKVTKVVLVDSTSGIEAICSQTPAASPYTYNIAGQKVDSDYNGIVIKNGKKYLYK